MNPCVACVIIAHEPRRATTLARCIASVTHQDFDEVVVVGDWPDDGTLLPRYLRVAPIQRTTFDALPKRDVGTLATRADTIVYLNDDHALAPYFLTELREVLNEPWDVLVPNRVTYRTDDQGDGTLGPAIALNMGEKEGYCGGHAGVFRRSLIRRLPWCAGPHDRLWDLHMSQVQRNDLRARFVWSPREEITVIDLLPEDRPWL